MVELSNEIPVTSDIFPQNASVSRSLYWSRPGRNRYGKISF